MSYYRNRLSEYGLTPEAPVLNFKWTDLDMGGAGQTCQYFVEHEEGVEIHTPTVDGERPYHMVRKKKKFLSRLRVASPSEEEGKYRFTSTFKKDHESDIKASWLFIPPMVYEAVKAETHIQTLYITEGEFKAFVPSMYDLPFIGIPGIHNFRTQSKGAIHEGIARIIEVCKVENVVIFYDSDLIELSTKLGKNDKSADARPRSFMRSAEHFRRLLLKENVNVYLGHIKPREEKAGIDDLFKISAEDSQKSFKKRCNETAERLKDSFEKAYTGQPAPDNEFTVLDITQYRGYDPETKSSYKILNRLFKLESYSKFYEYHKSRQLDGFESFRFNKILYDVKEGIPVLHDDQTKLKNPVFTVGNAYFTHSREGELNQLSDFRIKLEYVLFVGPGDTRRIASITNTHNETWFTELKITDFASAQGFANKLAVRSRFSWLGTAKQFLFVKALIEYDRNIIQAKMITRLGWQPDTSVWAYSNGIVKEGKFHPANSDGLVSVDEKGFFLPACSRMDSLAEDYLEDLPFCYLNEWKEKETPITLSEWVRSMESVFNTEADPNGTLGIMYAIMSLYSDVVFNTIRFCPLLYLTGIKGSGKNTLGQAIMALFGRYTPPPNIHNITGTAAGRLCSHFFNSIIWLDEWKNDIPKWKQELVKSAHDRTGKAVGTYSNDDRIKRVKYYSPVMVSGQDVPGSGPSDPALANRGMLLIFRVTERTEEAKRRRTELQEIEEKGITHITAELLTYRNDIETSFAATYTRVGSLLRREAEKINPKVSARLIDEYTCILTPTCILIEKSKIQIGRTVEELIEMAAQKLIEQDQMSESNSEQTQFWEIFETLVYMHDDKNIDNCREGYDYKIDGGELTLRMSKIYDKYSRYARRNNKVVLDLTTLTGYLKNHPSYKKGKGRSVYFRDKTTSSGLVFDRNYLPEAANIRTEAEADALAAQQGDINEIKLPDPPTNGSMYKDEYQLSKQN